jgi:predicted secreted hydrolase
MAHFALTDAAGERFFSFERFSRAAVELAGAELDPIRVWLEDWQLRGAEQGLFPLQLRAADDEVAIDLTLEQGKPLVLQGEKGLSQKSAEAGNASYYYSFTRLPARGTLTIGEENFAVEGSAWLDREWSTSALAPDQVGWDWFALQFEDGRELMYYRLRNEGGETDPASQGVLVDPQGGSEKLAAGDVELEPLETWRSPRSGARYPVSWRLRVPGQEISLQITPVLRDQELQTTLKYWEGAVSVAGRDGEAGIDGWGYVELTGYAPDTEPE